MLLTLILLAITPFLYSKRYVDTLHVTAICSLVYTLRTLSHSEIRSTILEFFVFSEVRSEIRFCDQACSALLGGENKVLRAVGFMCAMALTGLILLVGNNPHLTWRPYVDIVWLVALLFILCIRNE